MNTINQHGRLLDQTSFKTAASLKGKQEVKRMQSQRDIDDISTDADLSDEYGSASDSSRSVDKASRILPANINSGHKTVVTDFKIDQTTGKNAMNLTKEVWRKADAVCFDVDSTVCCDEAIDELARYVNKTKEVSDITKAAMLGGANFRDALAKRLDIIRPDTRILSQYLKTHKPRLTPYIEDLVARLHQLGRDVYLISGGFDVIIEPAANILNIPMENVFANSIKFYFDGSYAGFDKSRPTSNQDGKSRVISMLKQTKGYKNVVMIGDGVTDLEACPPADAFIGFGGNQIRETVRDNSDWFVHSFKELITALP
jgi:phosphoserine phosphatase